MKRMEMITSSNSHGGQNLGTLLDTRNQKKVDDMENKGRTEPKKIQRASVCREDYGNILLGSEGHHYGGIPTRCDRSRHWEKYTANANRYFDTLIKLRAAIKAKRPSLLSKGVILLHDSAKPYTAGITSNLLKDFKWEIFDHSAYSRYLAPSDFHLIPGLKEDLSGKRFANEKDLQAAVSNFFVKMDREWYVAGIEKLIPRYNKCLDSLGNYAEK